MFRRLQVRCWKHSWQRLGHPSPPGPPPPTPPQTQVGPLPVPNVASMQRLANVTSHSVLVAWRSPHSQERWKIFLQNILSIKKFFLAFQLKENLLIFTPSQQFCWPISLPLADLSLAFFWKWRVIRVYSGKRGETRLIFFPVQTFPLDFICMEDLQLLVCSDCVFDISHPCELPRLAPTYA